MIRSAAMAVRHARVACVGKLAEFLCADDGAWCAMLMD